MNKKILISLSVIAAVAAIVVGGTIAYFSDTETSTGNTFTAGAIDLTIDNVSYVTNEEGVLVESQLTSWAFSNLTGKVFFNFSDLKPGDVGEDTISLHVDSNDAWACMSVNITSTPENGETEPEAKVDDHGAEGELQNELNFAFWADDGDNVYEVGEVIFEQGLAANLFDGVNMVLADSTGNAWGGQGPLQGGLDGQTTPEPYVYYIGKVWCYGNLIPALVAPGEGDPIARGTGFVCDGSQVGNISQSDGITADVTFYAEQYRNNPNFLCVPITVTELGNVSNPQTKEWTAEARHGKLGNADWEVGVGDNTQVPGQFDNNLGQTDLYNWPLGPTAVLFTLTYNSGTGIADFTVDGVETQSWNVGAISASSKMYIRVAASSGASDSSTLKDLVVDGNSLPNVTVGSGGANVVEVSGLTLTDGFTMTGNSVFYYSGTTGSRPAYQIHIGY